MNLDDIPAALLAALVDTRSKLTAPELAADADLSVGQTRTALGKLDERGVVYRWQKPLKDGGKPWVYWLNPEGRTAALEFLRQL